MCACMIEVRINLELPWEILYKVNQTKKKPPWSWLLGSAFIEIINIFFFQILRLKVSFWRSSDKSTSWIKMLLKCRLLQRLVAPTSHSQDSREGCCTLERLNTSAECTPALICDGREDNRGLISSYQDIKHLPEHF